tara:strand:+ start:676 stop:1101 length:426 start_codon:yes stop_codon:yes gene_type:complete
MLEKKGFENDAPLLGSIALTATAGFTSAACDLLNHDGSLLIVNMGNSGDTLSASVYWELEVEDSPDNSTWTDVSDYLITGAVTGSNTGTFAKVDAAAEDSRIFTTAYLGRQRYVRIVVNKTGTHTNGTPISSTFVRTRARY